jgi:hypothetical protein
MTSKANSHKRETRSMGIFLLVCGFLLWVFGFAGVTPSSVNVSGYYRSDGTYAQSYSRRPPGSVAHDDPFEAAEWFGFFSFCGGVYILVAKKRPNGPLIPYVSSPRKITQSTTEIELAPVPNYRGISDTNWRCEGCSRPFEAGTSYWYNIVFVQGEADISRYCIACRDKLILANRRTQSVAFPKTKDYS